MPRIGLLSDSHGRSTTTRRAVDLLLDQQVDMLIHLGDVGGEQVIDALVVPAADHADAILPVHLVFGNTDFDAHALATYARSLGVQVHDPVGRLAIESGQLAFCHGHDLQVMLQALAQGVKYLCHGHTHRASDNRRGPTRVINPGALFRAPTHTVAVLDTARDHVRFHSVADRR